MWSKWRKRNSNKKKTKYRTEQIEYKVKRIVMDIIWIDYGLKQCRNRNIHCRLDDRHCWPILFPFGESKNCIVWYMFVYDVHTSDVQIHKTQKKHKILNKKKKKMNEERRRRRIYRQRVNGWLQFAHVSCMKNVSL